jgi:hypothetical protein
MSLCVSMCAYPQCPCVCLYVCVSSVSLCVSLCVRILIHLSVSVRVSSVYVYFYVFLFLVSPVVALLPFAALRTCCTLCPCAAIGVVPRSSLPLTAVWPVFDCCCRTTFDATSSSFYWDCSTCTHKSPKSSTETSKVHLGNVAAYCRRPGTRSRQHNPHALLLPFSPNCFHVFLWLRFLAPGGLVLQARTSW